jgi:UPF0042 nucleotide-binding protein
MSPVQITTFGYLHGEPPQATITLDLRTHFKDPHVDPALRHLTAHDEKVQVKVMNTKGIGNLVDAAAAMVCAYSRGPVSDPILVAIGCSGDRHRAPAVGTALQAILVQDHRISAQIIHRDIDKPVIERSA